MTEKLKLEEIPDGAMTMPQSGGFNDMPPNTMEISEQEFKGSKFFYELLLTEFRQICRPNAELKRLGFPTGFGSYIRARIFWFYDRTGVIIAHDGVNVKYFKCAVCVHDITSSRISMHVHENSCTKCTYSERVDSSD